jgi:hypothetical protein
LVNWLYALLFIGAVVATPLLSGLNLGVPGADAFATSEQRPRRQLPSLALDAPGLRALFGAVEPYWADRMPFRTQLMSIRAAISGWLGQSLNPDLVVMGKDGWLFFGNQAGQGLDQHRGIVRLSESQLADLDGYFAAIAHALAARQTPFVVAIAPDKHSIYPDYLPDHLATAGDTPYDQILRQDHDFCLVNLRDELRQARRAAPLPLYSRTDSHWNEYGAYLAYRAIMAALPTIPGIACLNASTDDFRAQEGRSGGDGAQRAGPGFRFRDTHWHLRRDLLPGWVQVENREDQSTRRWPAGQANRVSAEPSLTVTREGGRGTLLVLGDSFTEALSPYLNNTFGRVVYQHYTLHQADGLEPLIAQFAPDAVVYVLVERNLLLPTSSLIALGTPVAGRTRHRLSAEELVHSTGYRSQIDSLRLEGGSACFRATGFDPYLELPPIAMEAAPAIVRVRLTLPREALVQLYYQTTTRPQFAEDMSVRVALPAGEHTLEWRLDAPLNGCFRLDPGNAPGTYTVRGLEVVQ